MTPEEFIIIKTEQEIIIKQATKTINLAREEAEVCPVPDNLRPAVLSDVVKGTILWYPFYKGDKGDLEPFWRENMLHFADAYMAGDGAMHYLDEVYVEIETETDQ